MSSFFVVLVLVVVGGATAGGIAELVVDEAVVLVLLICGVGCSMVLLLLDVVGTDGVYDGAGRVRPRFRTASSRTTFFHLLTRVS